MNQYEHITQQWQYGANIGWSDTHLMLDGHPVRRLDPAPRYDESTIEYWRRIYQANRLYEQRAIRFDVFLTDPCGIIEALLWSQQAHCEEEFRPLLARQQHIADTMEKLDALHAEIERIEADLDAQRPPLTCRNGAWHEPLKHHAHPRSRPVRAQA